MPLKDQAEHNEYVKMRASRQAFVGSIVKSLSGCSRCGYDRCSRALHWHHIDPHTKLFDVGRSGRGRSLERTAAEVEKCELLCANCHAEVEHAVHCS